MARGYGISMEEIRTTGLTVLLPAGRLPLAIMDRVRSLAEKYHCEVYLTGAQNLRLVNIGEEYVNEIRASLRAVGARFSAPGQFPLPKICPGVKQCAYSIIETEQLSAKILETFSGRKYTKPKFKIAIAGCSICCSNAKLVDLGIVGTKNGYDFYVGGKGGKSPKTGVRIGKNLQEVTVLDMLTTLVEFHDRKTAKKQRMHKLLSDPDFPFVEV